MAINFPNSPTNNQVHTVGNVTYYYNSSIGAWLIQPPQITATYASVGDQNSSSNVHYITFITNTSGNSNTIYVSSEKLRFDPSTGILTSTVFNAVSDADKKYNIQTFCNALDTVDKLRGVSFNWKDNGQPSVGVIAQELATVIPSLVHDKAVNYDGIIGVLIQAIKELKAQVEELKNGK